MKIPIIQIGNSKGLRLNKQLLEQYEISDEIEMILEEDKIIIKPIKKIREGWGDAFKKMASNNDDQLLMSDVFEDEEFEEWS